MKNPTTEIRSEVGSEVNKRTLKILEKLTSHLERLAFLELSKFLGNICFFEQIFTENSRWVPLSPAKFNHIAILTSSPSFSLPEAVM